MATQQSYRTYLNKDGEKEIFTVFIIHGTSNEWRKVKKYINHKLNFATIVLKEEADPGILLNLFKESIWEDCDCSVAVLSPDEKIDDERFFPRQNVLYEIGYCQGFWDHYHWQEDLECVFLFKEESVEINSDLHGFKVIPYKGGSMGRSLNKLESVLENLFYYLDETQEIPEKIKISKAPKKAPYKKSISLRMIRKK